MIADSDLIVGGNVDCCVWAGVWTFAREGQTQTQSAPVDMIGMMLKILTTKRYYICVVCLWKELGIIRILMTSSVWVMPLADADNAKMGNFLHDWGIGQQVDAECILCFILSGD